MRKNIAETHPYLLSEWDYSKNTADINTVTHGSDRSYWWICPNGHSWEDKVSNRTRLNRVCPICKHTISFQELKLITYLEQYTQVISGHTLNDDTVIDLYLPEYNVGIEYNGVSTKYKVRKDIIKTVNCKEEGIRLIRIREESRTDVTYGNVIVCGDGMSDSKKVIRLLCKLIGIPFVDYDEDELNDKVNAKLSRRD